MIQSSNLDAEAASRLRLWDAFTDFFIAAALAGVGVLLLLRLPEGQPPPGMATSITHDAYDFAWLLLAGAGAIILARTISAFDLHRRNFFLSRALIVALPAIIAMILLYNRIWYTKTAIIDGERYFWLDDDMMISMRFAKHFAEGHGLVWNASGQRVEGYSNFLWTLVIAVPHAIGIPQRLTSGAVLGINAALLVLVLWFSARIGRRMGLRPAMQWLALLMIASNRWVIHWAAAGSENILLALSLLIAADRVLDARRPSPMSWGGGLIVGLIALVRADGLVLMAAFFPAMIFLAATRRARPAAFITAIALPIAHFAFRKYYYGEWLPNTYALKVQGIHMKYAMGVFYASYSFFFPFMGICALQFASVRLAPKFAVRWLAIVPWVGIAYTILIGGDELPETRFFVPHVPLLVLGAALTVQALFLRARGKGALRRGRRFSVPGAYAWVVLILLLSSSRLFAMPKVLHELGTERSKLEQKNVRIGLMLRKNTEPDALIAHFWAGAAPYFSNRPAHDMLGKIDAEIASRPGQPWQWQPGHTKYDPAYSMSLEPDVVVSALQDLLLDPRIRQTNPSCATYPALCAIYEDPVFMTRYAPGLVPLELSRSFHAVYVRIDTEAARPPGEWVP